MSMVDVAKQLTGDEALQKDIALSSLKERIGAYYERRNPRTSRFCEICFASTGGTAWCEECYALLENGLMPSVEEFNSVVAPLREKYGY